MRVVGCTRVTGLTEAPGAAPEGAIWAEVESRHPEATMLSRDASRRGTMGRMGEFSRVATNGRFEHVDGRAVAAERAEISRDFSRYVLWASRSRGATRRRAVSEFDGLACLADLRQIRIAEQGDLAPFCRYRHEGRVHFRQNLRQQRLAGGLGAFGVGLGARDLPWFLSKSLIGRLKPKPIVLSGPMRWYSTCGVTSDQALALARLMSARAFSRAASAARRSGRESRAMR